MFVIYFYTYSFSHKRGGEKVRDIQPSAYVKDHFVNEKVRVCAIVQLINGTDLSRPQATHELHLARSP